jgi:D-arabinose 5-phosphate isomerase GutQ
MVDDMSTEINAIDNSIVSKNGEVGFIESLESLARENGLSIEISSLTFDNNASLASSSINILNVKAKTDGSWFGNYAFLSRLESLPFKVKINMVSLTNSSSNVTSDVNNSNPSNDTWQSVFEISVLKYK